MSAPAVVITVAFEATRPHVQVVAMHDVDVARLELWLNEHHDLRDLVDQAVDLTETSWQ
jgi:hypothetical protein